MSLRALVFNHPWLKLFSLILATLVWLAVWAGLPKKSGIESTRIFVGRPIQVLAASPDHPRVVLSPDHATVTVRGPEELIQGMKEEDVDAFVRLPDKRGISGPVPLQVHVPAGASVTAVAPITTEVT